MLLKTLKEDNLTFRKAKDTVGANLLTTLVSEASMIGKNDGNRESTDQEVIRVIKKFLDNAKETYDIMIKGGVAPTEIEREISILKSYLPNQMSEDDLRDAINNFRHDNPTANIGLIMKYLQINYAGLYDGKVASQIVKEGFVSLQ